MTAEEGAPLTGTKAVEAPLLKGGSVGVRRGCFGTRGQPAPVAVGEAASVLGLPPVAFSKLYTFAMAADIAGVVLACVCGAGSGAVLPLFSLLFGGALDAVTNPSTDEIVASVSRLSLQFLYIAVGAAVLTFAEGALISYTTERQLAKLRAAYTRSLLRLDAAWFDSHRAGECVTRLAEASVSVGSGMERLATTVRYCSTLVCGVAIGFSTSAKLTLVIAACAPFFAAALGALIFTAITSERAERTANARAGDVATEVLSLIRAVSAYGGEAHEAGRYARFLRAAQAAGVRKGLGLGAAVGTMLIVFFAQYGIATWAGAKFVVASREADAACRGFGADVPASCFTGGDVITTFVAVLLGALSFGNIGPLVGQIAAARAAAADLYGVIDARPAVDVSLAAGHTPSAAQLAARAGVSVEFRRVTFAYPSRPESVVLRDFSLALAPG